MKRYSKRFISLLTVISIMVSCFAIGGMVAYAEDISNLELTLTADDGYTLAGTKLYLDVPIPSGTYALQAGDVLKYEVTISERTAGAGGFDLLLSGGAIRDREDLTWPWPSYDQNGVHSHPKWDISSYAYNKIYQREVTLNPNLAGQTVDKLYIAQEVAESISAITILYSNIRIENGGTVKKVLYDGTQDASLYPETPIFVKEGNFSYTFRSVSETPTRMLERLMSLLPSYITYSDLSSVERVLDAYNNLSNENKATLSKSVVSSIEALKQKAQELYDTKILKWNIKAPSGGTLNGNILYLDLPLSGDTYTVRQGDVLHYDVYVDQVIPGTGGADLILGGLTLRDWPESDPHSCRDQNGVFFHPNRDISPYAGQKWYHRTVNINYFDANLDVAIIAAEITSPVTEVNIYYASMYITNGNSVRKVIFDGTQSNDYTSLSKRDKVGDATYSTSLITDSTPASRVSKQIAALPVNINVSHKADVQAAREAYDALSPEQKAHISGYLLKKLEMAEKTILREETYGNVKFGDVDRDTFVTSIDAMMVLRYSIELIDFSPEELVAAEVSNDGKVNIYDSLLILQRSVDYFDEFPIEKYLKKETDSVLLSSDNWQFYAPIMGTADPVLRVGVNTVSDWETSQLSEYADNGFHWISTEIPVSSLVNGSNRFTVTSNVYSLGNLQSNSFDLTHFADSSMPSVAFIGKTPNLGEAHRHANRAILMTLRLYDPSTGWEELKYVDGTQHNNSCVSGIYEPDGENYYHAQDYTISNVSRYTKAELLVYAHVGADIRGVDIIDNMMDPSTSLEHYNTDSFAWRTATVPASWETYGSTPVSAGPFARYNGIGWYKLNFDAEELAPGEAYTLSFDAVDYAAYVWLNGYYLGYHEGGYTSFEFDLSGLPAGVLKTQGNVLTLKVIDQGPQTIPIKETPAGFLQDSINMNYAGIWGDVYLNKHSVVTIDDIFIETTTGPKAAKATVTLKNSGHVGTTVTLSENVTGENVDASGSTEVKIPAGESAVAYINISMPDALLWSADSPNLYSAKFNVVDDGVVLDTKKQTFGVRTIAVNGNKFVLNGQNIFLTGVLHWLFNYPTYNPAVNPTTFRENVRTLKAAGFNAIKFCLVIPPDYIMDICDEEGIYTYIEYPNWNPTESDAMFARMYDQIPDMIVKDRNHPSLICSDFNCEMLSFTPKMDALMNWCVNTGKQLAPNRLYMDNSGNGIHKYGDFAAAHPYNQLNSFEEVGPGWVTARGGQQPVVFGEYADTDAIRDLAEITATHGGVPWWRTVIPVADNAETMRNQGLDQAQIQSILNASIENASESKRQYIEETKKTDGMAGLFITHFNDIGSTTPGLYDELGRFRFDVNEFYESCNEASLSLYRRTQNMWNGYGYPVTPSLSYYNGKPITNGRVEWSLINKATGAVANSGTGSAAGAANTSTGGVYRLGELNIGLPASNECVEYSLEIKFVCDNFTSVNHWDIWGYPANFYEGTNVQYYDPSNILGNDVFHNYNGRLTNNNGTVTGNPDLVICTALTSSIKNYLNNGGKVIYNGSGSDYNTVTTVEDFSHYTMIYSTDATQEYVGDVGKNGYGLLQFLDLATPDAISSNGNRPIFGRIDLRGYGISNYMNVKTVGSGTLLQTTFHLGDGEVNNHKAIIDGGCLLQHTGDNTIGKYLLDQLIRKLVNQ